MLPMQAREEIGAVKWRNPYLLWNAVVRASVSPFKAPSIKHAYGLLVLPIL